MLSPWTSCSLWCDRDHIACASSPRENVRRGTCFLPWEEWVMCGTWRWGREGCGWANLYNRTQGSLEEIETWIPTFSSQDPVIKTWLFGWACSLLQGGSEQGFLQEKLDETPEIEACGHQETHWWLNSQEKLPLNRKCGSLLERRKIFRPSRKPLPRWIPVCCVHAEAAYMGKIVLLHNWKNHGVWSSEPNRVFKCGWEQEPPVQMLQQRKCRPRRWCRSHQHQGAFLISSPDNEMKAYRVTVEP